jgi:REP element-mobilizing transposase RayT
MMRDCEKRYRRSPRLPGYDYSQSGAYFVTICTNDRLCLFGDLTDGVMSLNPAGDMVCKAWSELPERYQGVNIDAFVVMPNHVHGIIVLNSIDVGTAPRGRPYSSPFTVDDNDRQPQGVAPTDGLPMSLPDIVHRLKSWTTKLYSDGVKQYEWTPFHDRLWQHNYYEHVIRNESDLHRIRQYILENPAAWSNDEENPNNPRNR